MWGLKPDPDDPMWQVWNSEFARAYESTQRRGIGKFVNSRGYKVLSHIPLQGKAVLEIGPGEISHCEFWKGSPATYSLLDVRDEVLSSAAAVLNDVGVMPVKHKINGPRFPIENETVDIVLSFYNLEHLHPLPEYLQEIKRVMKRGALLVGAIPVEGGLAWGIGRRMTSARWFARNSDIDLYRIICWEHPNFADEIEYALMTTFRQVSFSGWPFPRRWLRDLNLIICFICTK